MKKISVVFSILVVAAMVLSACSTAATEAPVVTEAFDLLLTVP